MNSPDRLPIAEETYVPHLGWLAHEANDDVACFIRQGHYEFAEQAFLWLFLRPGDVFIDGGAHFGLYSVLASKVLRGHGRILSVEPSPDTVRILRQNLAAHGAAEAEVCQVALWSEEGTLQLRNPEGQHGGAYRSVCPVTRSTACGGVPPDAIQMEGTTLRALAASHALGAIAFLKLDVEGAEIACLDGAADLIRSGDLALLMIEFTELNLRQYGGSTRDLYDRVLAAGLNLHRFDPLSIQLRPMSYDGEIWYENLFATRDAASVNTRLREAAPAHHRIAQDILQRGWACQKIRELQELDYYKAKAKEADALQGWAERSDVLLSQAREEVAAGQRLICQTEGHLAQERRWREELRALLDKTSQSLADEHRRCAELALALKQASA